jgi:uncharacterized protein YecE (DUF72 family)
MNFWLGCAVWAYKEWVGDLFPPGSRSTDFLSLYSQRFTSVEGNTTFYSTPDSATVNRWVAETPDSFQFCFKLSRNITHRGFLMPNRLEAIAFLDRFAPLGKRLGPYFAQLPPSYGPDQFEDLAAFLNAWPQQKARLAIEVRHVDWFQPPHCDRLHALLQELGIGRVLLDSRPIYECPDDPQLHSERRKPQLPLQFTTTADFSVIRYISHPDQDFNDRYLREWSGQIDAWLRQGKLIYFFVHCPLEVRSPANARYFQRLLEDQQAPVPPLPWNQFESIVATQLRLF